MKFIYYFFILLFESIISGPDVTTSLAKEVFEID